MKKQTIILLSLVLFLPVLSFVFLAEAQEDDTAVGLIATGSGQKYTESIPVIDISDFGYQPAQMPSAEPSSFIPSTGSGQALHNSSLQQGGGSDPNNPYAVIRKTGPTYLQPGGTARYGITLANYESVIHTYRLTDTLPSQLAYVPNPADDLTYDPATRTLAWQGEVSPGHLDYVIDENSLTLPYLDLADFGAVNLCDDFIANGEDCDDVTVTFNLGVNGYTANLYGETLTQLVISSNGIALAGDTPDSQPQSGHNQWLPDASPPGHLLAGLWRDADMTNSGRFHAAIISSLIEGYDVFYAQWHDAPHVNDPDLTARHAIVIVLNGDGALTGHAFFIYDNISDPTQTIAQGYTIGIEDKLGVRGVS